MNPTTLARVAVVAALAALVAAAAPAHADDVVAADSASQSLVIAVGGSGAGPSRPGAHAAASLPGGIVVTDHGGKPVSLFAQGQPPLRKARPGRSPATFTGLRAGTAYTVVVGGRSIGRVIAVDRPGSASRLIVNATGEPGVVRLQWRYHDLARTGGSSVTFQLSATSRTAPTVTTRAQNTRSGELSGLDPTALYTFSVTVVNSAGHGRATSATMTKTLAQLVAPAPVAVPPDSPPDSPPAPVAPAPPPPAPPATRTIYVCPNDYVENSSGTCTRTIPYTFHQEPSGPAPLLVSYEVTSRACPSGYSLEDYGWIMYCRLYGPIPMAMVKDATPSGYTDDGTAWVRTVPKDAVVVPA